MSIYSLIFGFKNNSTESSHEYDQVVKYTGLQSGEDETGYLTGRLQALSTCANQTITMIDEVPEYLRNAFNHTCKMLGNTECYQGGCVRLPNGRLTTEGYGSGCVDQDALVGVSEELCHDPEIGEGAMSLKTAIILGTCLVASVAGVVWCISRSNKKPEVKDSELGVVLLEEQALERGDLPFKHQLEIDSQSGKDTKGVPNPFEGNMHSDL